MPSKPNDTTTKSSSSDLDDEDTGCGAIVALLPILFIIGFVFYYAVKVFFPR